MDPEAVKALVDRVLMRLGEEVERYGGTVDKYIGDNVMAIFGAPVAHEDDEERAVRAGLGMQAAMGGVNVDLPDGVTFELRVGVNTGEVLAGAVGEDYTVVGDVVNVAARLQSAARPGSVTVGERTMRASSGAVRYEQLEPLELKGKSEPVPAWEAVAVRAQQAVGRGAPSREAPLVGRSQVLSTLTTIFDRVELERAPHLVTLVGEAGVGKSRVLRELESQLCGRVITPTFRTGRCLPYGSGIVFWALGEVLREECGIVDTDSAEEAWGKLREYAVELFGAKGEPMREEAERRTALIARLIGLEVPAELVPMGEDPERLRESFFSALRAGIEAMAGRQPLVLAFEDIHWADDGMLDAIEHLAQWVRAPLLLVCLARDELLDRRPSWGGGRGSATQLVLEPLSASETESLVAALLPAGETVPQAVVERSGGNPLFAEEMARRISEDGSIKPGELPDTVQAVLAARLDALEPFERRLVQQAAVVGRTFWEGSLAPLAGSDQRELERALVSLQEKDILAPGAESQLTGERELAFKHVLIRDVAYGMLPKAVRARKHFEVGTFIEDRAGDRTDEVVSLLAEHYGRAAALGREGGLPIDELDSMQQRAMLFLEQAGDAGALLFANREAAAHYRHARADLPAGRAPGRGADRGEARRRVAAPRPRGRGDRGLARVPRLAPGRGGPRARGGPAPQDRRRALPQGRAQDGDRALPEGHQPAQGRAAAARARAPLRGGGVALPAHRRQHARHLRVREGAAAGRAARRDPRRQPGARDLRPRVRPDRRHREGAPEPRARRGAGARAARRLPARRGRARAHPREDQSETILALSALGRHLEVSEAEVDGARAAYEEALALAEKMGSLPAQVELHASLAQLAVYGADWEQVERSTEASAELAEREGLVGKLCLPTALRGLLRWREGNLDESTVLFHRAHELAEQVGWSELAFQALFGLATSLRDSGDLAGAQAALDRALDVCERAGLIAQSIQATAARAVVLMLAHRREAAVEAAQEASELAERLHYPIGRAAALEAQGVCAEDPRSGRGAARRRRPTRGPSSTGRSRPPARGCWPARCWSRRTPSADARCSSTRPRRSSASGCATCPSGRGRWRAS